MATAGIQYNRIRLNFSGAWNLGGKTAEVYSNQFVLSGASPLADASIEPTALDLFEPMRLLSTSGTELISFSYYAPNAHAATKHVPYPAGTHPCTAAGYLSPNSNLQQAEVCILCEGPTDKNVRGKQVYLRKWIHHVQSGATGNEHGALAAGDPLAKWKNGAGPQLLVPIDPDSGMQASTWTINTHLYTHQFRKGKKRKPVTNTVYVPLPTPLP